MFTAFRLFADTIETRVDRALGFIHHTVTFIISSLVFNEQSTTVSNWKNGYKVG